MSSPKPDSGHLLLRAYLEREQIKKADFATSIGVTPSALSQYIAEDEKHRVTPKAPKQKLIAVVTGGVVPEASWETADDRAALRLAVVKHQRAAGGAR